MSFKTIISIEELERLMPGDGLIIFDCRFELKDPNAGRRQYHQSHVAEAHYGHLDQDLSGPILPGKTGRHPLPDPIKFMKWLGSCGVRPGVQVVAYDQWHGGIAARLWWLLNWVGHPEVAVLDGGWRNYEASGLPTATEASARGIDVYPGQIDKDLIGTISEVAELSEKGGIGLLDARAASRYRGAEEPIDPVAGHIPGAQNLPFLDSLNEQGLWRPASELLERFASETEIVYCGSGVTACHNILAMKHAGLSTPKLYPGSWSEWILDESRPIAVIE